MEQRILVLIKARWILIAGILIYAGAIFFLEPSGAAYYIINQSNLLPLLATYLLLIAYNGWLHRSYKKHCHTSHLSFFQIVSDAVILISLVYYTGGISSWIWVGYPLLIFETAFLLDQEQQVWYVAAGCTTFHIMLTYVERLHIITPLQIPFFGGKGDPATDSGIFFGIWVALTNFYFAFMSITLLGAIKNRELELERAKEGISSLIKQTSYNLKVRYDNPNLVRCWEILNCKQPTCPSYNSANWRCWQVSGTLCRGSVQGIMTQKLKDCRDCKVYKLACQDELSVLGEQFNNMMHLLETDSHIMGWANQMSLKDDLGETLELLIETISQSTGSQDVSIVITDEAKCHFVKKTSGMNDEMIKVVQSILRESLAPKIFHKQRILYIEEAGKWEYSKLCSLDGPDFMPIVMLYLSSSNCPVGIITVTNKKGNLPYTEMDMNILSYLADTATIAISNQLYKSRLEETYLNTIEALTSAIEAKDPYTEGHAKRVSQLCLQIGRAMNMPQAELRKLKYAGLLHDIGKIVVDLSILTKPGKLTQKEFSQIKIHPMVGVQIIQHVGFLKDIQSSIRHHHEWFNGQGYPDGIKGEEIELGARIISIADAYDAMISDRPYRKALTPAQAAHEIRQHSGTQFDPCLVDVMLEQVKAEIEKSAAAEMNYTIQLGDFVPQIRSNPVGS